MTNERDYLVGVDIGGTFTDATVVTPDGRVIVGKASTTPQDFSQGFFASIASAAAALQLDERALLRATRELAHGTTVGINALVTGDVAKVALLSTRGHGDAIRTMSGGGRVQGASLEELLDYSSSSRPDPVVPREQVFEIDERIDSTGQVIVALSEAGLDAAIDRFEADGIEAVAISFLWSFVEPSHEMRAAERIRERRPDLFVSSSSEIAPRIGEYPRTVSTVLNAQIGPLMLGYIDRIVRGARERGFAGDVLFGQSEGGLVSADQAARFPIITLQSGPVAGVMGCARVGKRMGFSNVIVTDMGGTTLDVATIDQGRVDHRQDSTIARHRAYLRKVDVESVGAGGGSIAWIHEDSGTLRVGPQSAGALPGPICYGRGGSQPTVTDADLILGILDPSRPLAGGLKLDRNAALRGIAALGDRLGLSPHECAAGIVEIVDSRMEDLIRRVTVQRGADPRSFVLWAFGGASGAHAGLFSQGIGVREVVFPLNNVASVWSAYGLTLLDHARTFQRNVSLATPFDLDRLALELDILETRAKDYARSHQLHEVEVHREADMKYPLQAFEVAVPVPDGDIDASFAACLEATFHEAYEGRFGAGTGYTDAGAVLTTLLVSLRSPRDVPPLPQFEVREPLEAAHHRDVYWREMGTTSATPIFVGAAFGSGHEIVGPAVVEYPHTTIAVRPEQRLRMDDHGNLILALDGGAKA